MRLRDVQRNWDRFGTTNPYWAIETSRELWDVADFFKTGRDEVDGELSRIAALGVTLHTEAALDFGCGAGRLTQALARHFDAVTGVDIAPSMIALAREHDELPDRCSYLLNETGDLRQFADDSFDLVYSSRTLQHMEPVLSLGYVEELLRVARPDGLVVFQLPSPRRRQRLRALLPAILVDAGNRLRTLRRPLMEMYGVERAEVERLMVGRGATVAHVRRADEGGDEGYVYYVRP